MTVRYTTLADEPHLAERVLPLLGSAWPAYMLEGSAPHGLDVTEVLMGAPGNQVVALDGEQVLAAGLSAPIRWDGTLEDLPAGWDDAMVRSARLQAAGEQPNAASAVSITVAGQLRGQGLSRLMLEELKAAAGRSGARALICPLRPTAKSLYPLIPLAEYATWTRADGDAFDPWIRVHQRAGARILQVAERSMVVTGTRAQWAAWSGCELPGDGAYVIPGALSPVRLTADEGLYVEENLYVEHRIG